MTSKHHHDADTHIIRAVTEIHDDYLSCEYRNDEDSCHRGAAVCFAEFHIAPGISARHLDLIQSPFPLESVILLHPHTTDASLCGPTPWLMRSGLRRPNLSQVAVPALPIHRCFPTLAAPPHRADPGRLFFKACEQLSSSAVFPVHLHQHHGLCDLDRDRSPSSLSLQFCLDEWLHVDCSPAQQCAWSVSYLGTQCAY
jgi:hypothetical protein